MGAVILDGPGGILLTRRLRAPEAGFYSIPGGKVDSMEKLEHRP
jgi:8-oxo-dGTP diphosphatase